MPSPETAAGVLGVQLQYGVDEVDEVDFSMHMLQTGSTLQPTSPCCFSEADRAEREATNRTQGRE